LLAAKQRLANGDQLSSDDLLNLTQETVMSDQAGEAEARRTIQTIYEKRLSAEKRERLQQNDYRPTDSSTAWDELHAQAEAVMAKGETGSPEAMDLARRWMIAVNQATGNDPALNQKVRAMWQEALQEPAVAAASPVSLEMMSFIGEAYQKALAAGVASYP
jgi:hypothetical protein